MGSSSYTNTFVGFKIDADNLFDYEEFDIFSCSHFKENPALGVSHKFCPDCGVKVYLRHGQNKELKTKFDGIINGDQDSMYNGAWHTQIGKHKVELRQLINNYHNEEDIFIGVWLYRFDTDSSTDSVIKIENLSTLPREDIMKKTLEMYGIPFDPDSFGIYILTDWF